jgi:hypothetical protein
MPRHRKERGSSASHTPGHRALHRENRPRRGVLDGVSRALRSGLGPSTWSAAGRIAVPAAARNRFRLARSLLVTPWFAAGAGVVIAAALAVNTPTALTYAPTGPGTQCSSHGCVDVPQGRPPEVTTATPGVAIRPPDSNAAGAGSDHAQQRGGMGIALTYHIVRQSESGFVAVITMPGAAKSGGWSLQFSFSAAHVNRVWGAHWQPSSDGAGGTANGPLPPEQGSSPASQTQPPPGMPASDAPDPDQMVVSATGRPQTPSSCTLDGITCSFGSTGADGDSADNASTDG